MMTWKICALMLLLLGLMVHHGQAGYAPNNALVGRLLQIQLPPQILEDFSYIPTNEGYRYSFRLADGSRREEIGYITNPGGDPQAVMVLMMRTNRPNRPRGMTKNRKLSPKALQSLAG